VGAAAPAGAAGFPLLGSAAASWSSNGKAVFSGMSFSDPFAAAILPALARRVGRSRAGDLPRSPLGVVPRLHGAIEAAEFFIESLGPVSEMPTGPRIFPQIPNGRRACLVLG